MDNERLTLEHGMLKRLSIGLIDQGAKLTRIVPDAIEAERVSATERRIALASRIEVPMKVLPWMRSKRTAQLAMAVERSLPDVIYALGRQAWPIAIDLADRIDRPVALDVWSAHLVQHAPRKRMAKHIGGYIVPTSPLAAQLRRRVESGLVSLIPMGVAIPREGRTIFDRSESISIAIIGSGRDLPVYRALLGALSRLVRDLPQLNVVIELRGPNEHEIWREITRLDLQGFVSSIQDASLHRSLISRCDVLIVPERFGEVSSLVLDCMAVGMAIVARHDPCLDMLIDEKTAILAQKGDVEDWNSSMRRCLTETEKSRALGQRAREYAQRKNSSSQQIAKLMDTFDKIISGENYRFDAEIHAIGR